MGLNFPLYISNQDSTGLYPNNTPYNFNVWLPYALTLPGKWCCSAEAIFISTSSPFQCKCIHVLMDCVDTCIMYGAERRLLATFPIPPTSTTPSSCLVSIGDGRTRITKQSLNCLKLDIVTDSFQPCTNLEGKVVLALRISQSK